MITQDCTWNRRKRNSWKGVWSWIGGCFISWAGRLQAASTSILNWRNWFLLTH